MKWKFDEMDFLAVKSKLADSIRDDARFHGVGPRDVAARMIERIVHVSSLTRGDILSRRLTRFDLDVLVNDLLLVKLIDDHRHRPAPVSRTLYVSEYTLADIYVLVAGRFGAESEATATFDAFRRKVLNSPGAPAAVDVFGWPFEVAALEAMSKVDVDF